MSCFSVFHARARHSCFGESIPMVDGLLLLVDCPRIVGRLKFDFRPDLSRPENEYKMYFLDNLRASTIGTRVFRVNSYALIRKCLLVMNI